ncbi:hypothetical protein TSUD_401140 [Trifolium subterraneum]|uniref:Uncharacterized protein n=1 Tax=Trifolium subterraneum TaxID=3900 RepID=A0A2Z6NNN4_TRISU|nr:hypothetical protein TSUD_401140 [Trifolium subterraneum]
MNPQHKSVPPKQNPSTNSPPPLPQESAAPKSSLEMEDAEFLTWFQETFPGRELPPDFLVPCKDSLLHPRPQSLPRAKPLPWRKSPERLLLRTHLGSQSTDSVSQQRNVLAPQPPQPRPQQMIFPPLDSVSEPRPPRQHKNVLAQPPRRESQEEKVLSPQPRHPRPPPLQQENVLARLLEIESQEEKVLAPPPPPSKCSTQFSSEHRIKDAPSVKIMAAANDAKVGTSATPFAMPEFQRGMSKTTQKRYFSISKNCAGSFHLAVEWGRNLYSGAIRWWPEPSTIDGEENVVVSASLPITEIDDDAASSIENDWDGSRGVDCDRRNKYFDGGGTDEDSDCAGASDEDVGASVLDDAGGGGCDEDGGESDDRRRWWYQMKTVVVMVVGEMKKMLVVSWNHPVVPNVDDPPGCPLVTTQQWYQSRWFDEEFLTNVVRRRVPCAVWQRQYKCSFRLRGSISWY